MTDPSDTPPDVWLRIRLVPDPAWPADQRLKAALKALGRRYGLPVVEVRDAPPPSPAAPHPEGGGE